MRYILTFLAVLTLQLSTFAHGEGTTEANATSTNFAGKVVDHRTGEALAGVEVAIHGTSIMTMTDFDGNFSFKNIKYGQYTLEIDYIAYEKDTEQINLSKNSNNSRVFKLAELE
ncbi:carboxypeptidase-like regulatory domain-containing protein [Persicobacter psychrovividus]